MPSGWWCTRPTPAKHHSLSVRRAYSEAVVRIVQRDEIRVAITIDDQPVDPQHEIDGAAANQICPGAISRRSQRKTREAESDVDEVVENARQRSAPRLGG